MKKFLQTLLLIVICNPVFSQHFDWAKSQPVNYNSNPSGIRSLLTVTNANEIIDTRVDSVLLLYTGPYGIQQVEKRDHVTGNLIWNFPLSSHCYIDQITTDKTGKIYVAGSFMDTLILNNQDTLFNTGLLTNFTTNTFLVCIDPQGHLVWKRNVQEGNSDVEFISALACDAQNNLWYSYSDFAVGHIVRVDGSGQDLQTFPIVNARFIGGMDFDIFGGLYIAGFADQGTFSFANLTYTLNDSYNYFVMRYNSTMQSGWAKFAHEVTVPVPVVKCDPFGNAFIASNLDDSTSFGNVTFHHPQWIYDLMVLKVDTSGNFLWGFQSPVQPTLTGDFKTGLNSFMDYDSKGNVYIGGTVRFDVDFGNGVLATATPLPYDALSFLAIDSSGVPMWTLSGGSDNFQEITGVAFDQDDNLFFSGTISDTAHFGNISLLNSGAANSLLGKIVLPSAPTAINELSQTGFSVYPNPSNGELNIPASLLNSTLKIYDISGRLMLQQNSVSQSRIDLRKLNNGLYFLNFNTGKKEVVLRWVKTGE